MLFSRGDLAALDGRRVAVIGTRNATATGRAIAHELGAGLAAAVGPGGLGPGPRHRRLGPPGRAHRRRRTAGRRRGVRARRRLPGRAPPALAGRRPPRAAAQRGPAGHARRRRSASRCATASSPPSPRSSSWSSPGPPAARSSPSRPPTRRGIPILAVPGSPRSPAAEGTNRLLVDGATPVIDVTDVLVALGLSTSRAGPGLAAGPADADARGSGGPRPLRRRARSISSGSWRRRGGRWWTPPSPWPGWRRRAGSRVSGGWFERLPGGAP